MDCMNWLAAKHFYFWKFGSGVFVHSMFYFLESEDLSLISTTSHYRTSHLHIPKLKWRFALTLVTEFKMEISILRSVKLLQWHKICVDVSFFLEKRAWLVHTPVAPPASQLFNQYPRSLDFMTFLYSCFSSTMNWVHSIIQIVQICNFFKKSSLFKGT